ncbi:MAG: hypothetical protein A2W17_03975 [Planctomycetes bacterium RBG_16_41_13]|nr:MAG: hypothetical protein A2W17_03975 [Planctomycetes bacterium RBG_16_41_13]
MWGLFSFLRAECLNKNLYVGTPIVWIPGRWKQWHERGSIGWKIVSRQIQKTIQKIGNKTNKVISWIYRPEQLHCVGLAKEDFTVYECYDEYSLSHIDGTFRPEVEDEENKLLEKADLVFTASHALFESRKKKHSNVHYAPNGVDFKLFNQAALDNLPVANDLKKIPLPRIGFIGNLCGRIDFNLLEKIALHNKKWSVVLMGPVEREVEKDLNSLQQQGNVHYLGYKPREILPQYLKGFDVCILPFKRHGWNEHSNPLKLWEYLSAGKPVVSTPIKEIETLQEVIWLAKDHEEFISALSKALHEVKERQTASGIEIARKHSWDDLTCNMFETVKKCLDEQRT